MLKTIIMLMACLVAVVSVQAQERPAFARENPAQYISVMVSLDIPANGNAIMRMGTLMSPSGLILTGLDALLDAELNFACEDEGHEQINVVLSLDIMTVYKACVITQNFDHNFALLQIEAYYDGASVGDLDLQMKPLTFKEDYYITPGIRIYSIMKENVLSFEEADITAFQLVESEGAAIKHAEYFVDLREITDEMLGTPIVNESGDLVGITTQRNIDANQANQQLVRVVPLATICLVEKEFCDSIRPDDGLPPQDRARVPSNALSINVTLDMEARAEEICKRYALVSGLADTDSGWGCFKKSDQSLVRDVTVPQIDDYCKEITNNMDAFALLSGSGAKAYQWECYVPDNE